MRPTSFWGLMESQSVTRKKTTRKTVCAHSGASAARKGRTYHYAVLGNSKDIDLNKLRSLGDLKRLTPEDIFGY